jgi:cytochrome d ubiquinol oxidase subunit I
MDPLLLARVQFALTTIYHFFFVPLTMGLSILVAVMETLYVRSGQVEYKRMAKFWGKLFLINFALGVVTGIVQEFQFGMNWSEYSRYVGDIFGAPLAIEALLAFFLESTFLGIWIFGWDKLSKGLHAATIWIVAIGANISALWILIANSFMQQPVGYAIENGRAVMIDFASLVLNPNIWYQFPHVFVAGLTTAAFFVLGISAYHILRKNEIDLFKQSVYIAAIIGTFSTIFIALNGHSQAQHMVEIQPMKTAATEALWESKSPAPLSLFTIGSLDGEREIFSIRLPAMLSLLSFNSLEGEVKGMNDLQAEYETFYGPGDYTPPPVIPYWSFRAMVGAGFAMVGLVLYTLFIVMGDMLEKDKRILRILVWAMALPYIANTAGWLLTEVGRYPWTVFGLIKLEDSVSRVVSPGMVLFSLIGYFLIYSGLILATVYLLRKYAKAGPEPAELASVPTTQEIEPSLVGG